MRKPAYMLPAVILLLLTVLAGCERDQNPVSGNTASVESVLKTAEGHGSITLTILHADGMAVAPNTKVELNAHTDDGIIDKASRTDANGHVVFNDLVTAAWYVDIRLFGFHIVTGIELGEAEQFQKTLNLPDTINLEIYASPWDVNYPPVDSEITLNPGSVKKIVNTKSKALFENLPFQAYNVEIKKNGVLFWRSLNLYIRLPYSSDSVVTSIFSLPPIPPEIEIVQSATEISYNTYDPPLTLTARANDFYLGELSGHLIQWKSHTDGFLGYGTTFEVDYLSLGTHVLTATVENSEHRTDSDSITLHVYGFSDQSFFPLPSEASWRYAVEPATMIVENDTGSEETWTFSDWNVISEQTGVHTGSMTCEATTSETVKDIEYSVTDRYALAGIGVLLTQVEERLTVTDTSSGTTESVRIVNEYDPPLVLFEDHRNPGDTQYRSQTTIGVISQHFSNNGNSAISRREHRFLNVTFETGASETIDTQSGMIEALPVTMTDGDDTRTIYYARGIGIVGTEAALFNGTLKTSLIQADIKIPGSSGRVAVRNERRVDVPVRIKVGADPMDRLQIYRQVMHTLLR